MRGRTFIRKMRLPVFILDSLKRRQSGLDAEAQTHSPDDRNAGEPGDYTSRPWLGFAIGAIVGVVAWGGIGVAVWLLFTWLFPQ